MKSHKTDDGERFRKKYYLSKHNDVTNRYAASITNPTVQPDDRTETGAPIPNKTNVDLSKKYGETNEL